jgi:signal transduction histidine kinase
MVFKNFLSKAKDIDLLANLADGVILVDSAGKIQYANEVSGVMFGTGKTDMLKSNINEFIEGGLDLAKQAALSGKSAVGRAKRLLEIEFFTEITANYTEDLLLVSLRDVTQNYKTVTSILVEHESSKKINKDKNAFLVKMSNELKSPVHSIIGFSQAMVDGLGGEMSEKQEKYIKIINKNSNELLYLMDKILELSKTESNLFEYDFQIFDGINTIQGVLKDYENQINDKKLSHNFDCDEIVKRTVFSDEGALKVILQNIIETSIKSTDIGSINVKAYHPELEFVSQKGFEVSENTPEKSYLMITVSDTGAGILEGDLGVLFEPYSQLDRPSKKHIVKSIALASVKNLVKHLKGSIWVESEPMQGTTYNVLLPIEKN